MSVMVKERAPRPASVSAVAAESVETVKEARQMQSVVGRQAMRPSAKTLKP